MPTHHPSLPQAPQPTRILFDPFNSTATGHQVADNQLSGSTSWRESRTYKLAHQFKDTTGGSGQQHLSDLVGAGSENYRTDGRKQNGGWEISVPSLRENEQQDIRELMKGNRKRTVNAMEQKEGESSTKARKSDNQIPDRGEQVGSRSSSLSRPASTLQTPSATSLANASPTPAHEEKPCQIFRNLTMYINGSTAPLISDHRLKHLFAQHGGNNSISLGRRTVTHVILGGDLAGGGGLANSKIQKEVALVRGLGKGVKYVTAEWVVDSIEKGVRQPESCYVPKGVEGRLGGSGQASVLAMFTPKTTK